MTITGAPALSWARNPLGRVLGSFIGWFLFSFCIMLLIQGFFGLMAVGGSCASGGPYVIETECPDAVALFMPLSIFGGLGAVAIAFVFTQGFGTSLVDLAWPILFCGLGSGFLWAFFASGEVVGLVIGLLFEIMGLIPLVFALRASVQRVFLGAVDARGRRFYEGEVVRNSFVGPRYGRDENAVQPTFADWSLSLGLWVIAAGLGYYAAQAAYAAV